MLATNWTPLLGAIVGRPYRAGQDLGEDRVIPAGTLVADPIVAIDEADEHQLEAILLRSQDGGGRIGVDRVRVAELRRAIVAPGMAWAAQGRSCRAGAPSPGARHDAAPGAASRGR
jgi:hypothetical protein